MKQTEAGQHWLATPSYDSHGIAFGFGDHRTVLDTDDQPYPSFLLHRITVGEARAIGADLLAAVEYLESGDE